MFRGQQQGGMEVNGLVGSKDKGQGNERKVFTVVFISLLIDLLAFTMILPLLPALLDYYGHSDKDPLYNGLKWSVTGFRELVGAPDTPRWNSLLFGGLIGSLFSCLQFLVSPVIGAASDVYGRKPVLLLTTVGIALSYVLWAMSHNFTIFVLARVVGGISKGNVSLSTAIIADVASPERRGRGMALIGVAFSLGFIMGPLIGAFFSRQARLAEGSGLFFTAPALLALLLALLDLMFIFAFFRETLPVDKRAPSLANGLQEAKHFISPLSLFRFSAVKGSSSKDTHTLRTIGVIYFLYLFIYSCLEFTLTFLTHNRFNYDSIQQGKMFFILGSVMALVQGGFVRRLKPGKEKAFSIRGIVLLIPAFLFIGFAYTQSLLYLGILMYAVASATVVPCLTTVVASCGTVDQKGTILGIFRSLGALARAVGPVVSCTVYWSFGTEVCYAVGAICLFIPLHMLCRIKISQHTD